MTLLPPSQLAAVALPHEKAAAEKSYYVLSGNKRTQPVLYLAHCHKGNNANYCPIFQEGKVTSEPVMVAYSCDPS